MLEIKDPEENSELEISNERKLFYKKILIKSGIFCGILCVFFGLLLSFTLLGRKSWRNGLKNEIQTVFESYGLNDFSVGEYVRIKNNTTVSCAVYKMLKEKKETPGKYAVIIRVPTVFGPMAAVYTFEKGKSEGKFIGFAHVKTRASKTVIDASLNMQIVYWGKRIPAIVDSEILPSSNKKNSGGKRNEKK